MNMYIEYAVLKALSFIANIVDSPQAAILMLHRTSSPIESALKINDMLNVDPYYLESFLSLSKKKGYSFISIDEMIFNLTMGKPQHKCLVVSIDDGYRCTYENAFPLLTSYDVPFIFYVSPAFPDKSIVLWWDIINDIIKDNDRIVLSDGNIIQCSTSELKHEAYVYLSKKILRSGPNVAEKLPLLFADTHVVRRDYNHHLLIDWAAIVEMSKNCLCTLGCHTTNHFGLRFEPMSSVIDDFMTSKSIMENSTGCQMKHLAYPYGTAYSVGFREGHIARTAGYESATTTYPSCIYKYHKHMLHFLPRINFYTVPDPSVYLYSR